MNINQYNPKGKLSVKHLLNINSFEEADIYEVLHLARKIKTLTKVKEKISSFNDETIAIMLSSTNSRVRISFELAVKQLGGNTLYLSPDDIDFRSGLTYVDAINVLKRFGVKGLVVRVDNNIAKELDTSSPLPLINLVDTTNNPCQLLANLLTVWEKKGTIQGNTLCYLGNSTEFQADTLKAYTKCGMSINIASPENLMIKQEQINEASQYGDIFVTTDVNKAVMGADLISSRFAVSNRLSEQDVNSLKDYIVTSDVLKNAKPNAYFMHILPLNHNEVSNDVLYGENSMVFDQAENLLYVEKALMTLLFK